MCERRILFVDDEVNILRVLSRLLDDQPYVVHTASSAAEGLAVLEDTPCQVIISDYRMPERNGIEFLQGVQLRWPDTVRMVLTGYADFMLAVEAVNSGAVHKLISKPWKDIELLLGIQEAFERHDLLHQKTVILITHRPASLALADRVIHLEPACSDGHRSGIRHTGGL